MEVISSRRSAPLKPTKYLEETNNIGLIVWSYWDSKFRSGKSMQNLNLGF